MASGVRAVAFGYASTASGNASVALGEAQATGPSTVAIGEAAKNSVLTSIVDGLWAGMFAPMYHRLSQRAGLDQHQAAALEDHEAIFAAISARNPNEARRAMRKHLHHVEEHLTSDDVPSPVKPSTKQEEVAATNGHRQPA